jgi:ParB/RepB/Spo0J family partition protein
VRSSSALSLWKSIMQSNSQDDVVRDLDGPDIPTDSSQATLPIVPTAEVAHDRRREGSMLSQAPLMLPLDKLDPHPQNPRLVRRDDVIEAIRASIVARGFDPARALIVRPRGDRFEIADGHTRADAARRAGLTEVLCWVRDLDDDEAYMLLLTSNAQGELSALERGLHALKSGMNIKAYAKSVLRKRNTVQDEVSAAKVAQAVPDIRHELLIENFSQLVVIHTSPPWLWPVLVSAMLSKRWTVATVRPKVARLKDLPADAPKWVSAGFCRGWSRLLCLRMTSDVLKI